HGRCWRAEHPPLAPPLQGGEYTPPRRGTPPLAKGGPGGVCPQGVRHANVTRLRIGAAALIVGLLAAAPCPGQAVKVVDRAADPHGSPRPARAARDVPPRTSLYLELARGKA